MEYSNNYPKFTMSAPNDNERQDNVPTIDTSYQNRMNNNGNYNYSPSAPTNVNNMPMPVNQNNNNMYYYNNDNNVPMQQYNNNIVTVQQYNNNNVPMQQYNSYQQPVSPQYQYTVDENIDVQLQPPQYSNDYDINGGEYQKEPPQYGYASKLYDDAQNSSYEYSISIDTSSISSSSGKSKKDRTKPFHNLPVLHNSKRKFSADIIFAILFFIVTTFIGYIGWRDRDNLTDPTKFCRFVTDVTLPEDMPRTASKASETFYENCLGFVVSGDEFAEGRCFSFGVNEVVKDENKKEKRYLDDMNMGLYRRANVSDDTFSTITNFYNECVKYIIDDDKSAANKCIRYAVNLIGKNENADDETNKLLNTCISPMINSEENSYAKCADYAITELVKNSGLNQNTSNFSINTEKIYESCFEKQDPEKCINESLQTVGININTEAVTQLDNQCIKPMLAEGDQKSKALDGCIKYGLEKAGVPTTLVTSMFSTCIDKFLTVEELTAGEDDRASRLVSVSTGCLRNVAISSISSKEVLNIIEEGVKNALGIDLGIYINDHCLQKSFIGAVNGDFTPSTCFLSGLATSFCKDLQKRSLGLATSFFDETLDALHKKLIPFTKVLVWIIISTAVIGLIWMGLIIIITSKIIYISIAFSLVNLSILILINLIIQNYIGFILLSIYFVFKIFWYIFTRHKVKFASSLLRSTMTSLYHQIGPFILAVVLFILSSIWFLLIFSAFITFNKPSVVNYFISYAVSGGFLVVCFFWTFEVGKNVMAVAISGVTATWYYFTSTNPEYVIRENHPSVHFPTIYSTGRAILSFGTICFGSLITASLRAFNYLYRKAENTDNIIVKSIILFFVSCFEYILQVYNENAFVIVAVYGSSYCKAAKKTSKIVKKNGVQIMVNNGIIDGVLRTGKSVSSFIVGFIGFVLAFFAYDIPFFLSTLLGLFGVIYGFIMLSMIAIVIEISSSAFFVCFADHPEVMAAYHPKMFKKFVKKLYKFYKDNNTEIPEFLTLPTKEERKLAKARHKAERKSKKRQAKKEKKELKKEKKELKKKEKEAKKKEMKRRSDDTVLTIGSSFEKLGSDEKLIQ